MEAPWTGADVRGEREAIMEPVFNHERLEVYQLSRDLTRRVQPLLRHIPRGQSNSRDNLDRAAKSITRNIAEGAGKWRVPDKVNFYRIAKASAAECAACLDELADCGVIPAVRTAPLKTLLSRITAMLIALIHATESRGTPDMRRPPPPAP
jgi:four helix bundle protein